MKKYIKITFVILFNDCALGMASARYEFNVLDCHCFSALHGKEILGNEKKNEERMKKLKFL